MTEARLGAADRAAEARRLAAIVGRNALGERSTAALLALVEMAAYAGAAPPRTTTHARTDADLVRVHTTAYVGHEPPSTRAAFALRAVYELGLADAADAIGAVVRDLERALAEARARTPEGA